MENFAHSTTLTVFACEVGLNDTKNCMSPGYTWMFFRCLSTTLNSPNAYIRNNTGPKQLPWSTPEFRWKQSDIWCLISFMIKTLGSTVEMLYQTLSLICCLMSSRYLSMRYYYMFPNFSGDYRSPVAICGWTNFRSWFIYGRKFSGSSAAARCSRKNDHLHHPSTVIWGLRHVWQVDWFNNGLHCFRWSGLPLKIFLMCGNLRENFRSLRWY